MGKDGMCDLSIQTLVGASLQYLRSDPPIHPPPSRWADIKLLPMLGELDALASSI